MQQSLLLSEVLLMFCLDQCLQKFINKTLQGGKRLLFNSDPWPPAEQNLEMPCDISGAQCGAGAPNQNSDRTVKPKISRSSKVLKTAS